MHRVDLCHRPIMGAAWASGAARHEETDQLGAVVRVLGVTKLMQHGFDR